MDAGEAQQGKDGLRRFVPLLVIALALGAFFALRLDRSLSFSTLIESRASWRAYVALHPLTALAGFVTLYAGLVAISAPGATIMTLAAGALFGPWLGAPAAALGATLGACALFAAARSSLGPTLARRAGPALARLSQGFQKDAASYMLFLRLSPLFPFWLVNLAAALAGAPFRTFVWTTAVGVLPAAAVFAYAGASLDSLAEQALAARRACLAAGGDACVLSLPASAIFSPRLIGLLLGFSLLALAPVAARRWRGPNSG